LIRGSVILEVLSDVLVGVVGDIVVVSQASWLLHVGVLAQ
jgi:hypothetical protein